MKKSATVIAGNLCYWAALGTGICGIIAMASSVISMFVQDRFWFGFTSPGLCAAIVCFWLMFKAFGAFNSMRKLKDEEEILPVTKFLRTLRRTSWFTSSAVVMGILVLIPSLLIKWIFTSGLSLAITVHSALLTIGILYIMFRLEIALHEVERGPREG
jgi:hypothetical protein